MQKKLKIITCCAVIFVLVALIMQYRSTKDASIVSFRNYVQDISNIIMGNTSFMPEYQPTTTNVKMMEENISQRDEFNYNAPVKEIDKKALLQTTTRNPKFSHYENRIRMEAPEELDSNGLFVALMQAVADNNMRRAKTLIARGARLDTPDGDTSYAPIFWAIDNGNVEMVKFLLSKGARVNTPDDKGLFPVHWIVKAASKRPSAYKMKEMFDTFLAVHPKEINRQDTKLKQTPIMFAVLSDNKKAFAYLLDHGANVNIINAEKMNIATIATANACHSCVYMIEEREKINKITPLENFDKTFPEPAPIWLPYTKKTTTTTTTKQKKVKKAPAEDSDVIVITGNGSNLVTPQYKEMPQILPLNEDDQPDIVMKSR